MKKESEYTIKRRPECRITLAPEYLYVIKRGSLKVGEVWLDATMKSCYDQRGKSVCAFSITDTGTRLPASAGQMVAYLILLNAYDWKTAEAWYKEVAGKMQMPTTVRASYKKSDIFAMILEAQQTKIGAP